MAEFTRGQIGEICEGLAPRDAVRMEAFLNTVFSHEDPLELLSVTEGLFVGYDSPYHHALLRAERIVDGMDLGLVRTVKFS